MKEQSKTCDDVEQGYEIIYSIGHLDLLNIVSFS